jgi:hypothetical protein
MSKKKEKELDADPPLDYQVHLKNLQYTIVLKDNEISELKAEKDKLVKYAKTIEGDYFSLKKVCANNYELEKEIGSLRHKNDLLQKEIDKLNQDILTQHKKHLEEKDLMDKLYTAKINQLQATLDGYTQKIEMTNLLIEENKSLRKTNEDLKNEKMEIIKKCERDLVELEVKNKQKIAKLKEKTLENIKETQEQVTEANMQYMDISSKLTLLQNHQLMLHMDYMSQQIEELRKSNQILDKKNFDLQSDIEIHKEVELSLANKNRKLKEEFIRDKKSNNNNEDNTEKNNNNTEEQTSERGGKSDRKNYNFDSKILNLEKKVLNLELKLNQKKKDFNVLKDKYEYIENVLKNYETKYLGIFNFLEDSLQNFYMDDELKSNQEVNLHIDELKKGNFSLLTKEEQYSTLVILMKYLMPLIDQTNLNKGDIINKVAVNFHFPNVNNNKFKERKIKKIFVQKQNDVFRSISVENIYNKNNGNKKVLPPLSVNSKNMARVGSGFGPIYKIKKIKSNSSGVSNSTNVI